MLKLNHLLIPRRLAPPAIWGRLPTHADFVRSGMLHGESEGWSSWIAQQGHGEAAGLEFARSDRADAGADTDVVERIDPICFILPPGTLAFAPRQFVIGAMVPSGDRAGRRHPLLVYQRTSRRWLSAHLVSTDSPVMRWLMWLSRAIAGHVAADDQRGLGLPALIQAVQALWMLHAPHMRSGLDRRTVPEGAPIAPSCVPALHDWPQRLFRSDAKPIFWQQPVDGSVLHWAAHPQVLWQAPPPPPDPIATESSPLRDARADPFGPLGLSRVPARHATDPMALLAGGAPRDAVARRPDAGQPSGWFDGLHAEFVRAVQDATSLAGQADWQAPTPARGETPPSLDELQGLAARFSRVRDILMPRGDVTAWIDGIDGSGSGDAVDFLAPAPPADVLRLFAPDWAKSGRTELPTLTLREHHVLSPHSPMSIARHPLPAEDPSA